jgi:hypothetical protein
VERAETAISQFSSYPEAVNANRTSRGRCSCTSTSVDVVEIRVSAEQTAVTVTVAVAVGTLSVVNSTTTPAVKLSPKRTIRGALAVSDNGLLTVKGMAESPSGVEGSADTASTLTDHVPRKLPSGILMMVMSLSNGMRVVKSVAGLIEERRRGPEAGDPSSSEADEDPVLTGGRKSSETPSTPAVEGTGSGCHQ